ncbi:hypothetical protein OE88DRAFT_1638951 [Heliocybe sulcata]|uniref:DNA endonuclease activator Ctp1 C-terminal domain-containing protein n=1 Tax=Heliocybe sulcata TaxID=5364 RepID=A0A5C3MMR1_9AGAM|nr:hypothetical protein OE88DRAFT_1638951 [Heliocybe sulcata]
MHLCSDADTTINALYEIDVSRNSGAAFAFSSVVRNKEHRKHLKGEDCECCRDYYARVGPLPPRLQAPLWNDKSLDSSTARHGQPVTPTKHRNAISKHRAQWAAPKTPPGYWDIGFPDTQEAAAINERAREMRREKMREVEVESR